MYFVSLLSIDTLQHDARQYAAARKKVVFLYQPTTGSYRFAIDEHRWKHLPKYAQECKSILQYKIRKTNCNANSIELQTANSNPHYNLIFI